MTENGQSDKTREDEDDDSLAVNLGLLKLRMTGQLVKTLTPFIGWSMVFLAIAYAISLVIGAIRNGTP